MKHNLSVFLIFLLANFFAYAGDKCKLIIFHAGSLTVPFSRLEKVFEEKHPGCEVLREASGSRLAARKVAELAKQADIVAVSDYTVIDEILKPEYAVWNLYFARNRMVIAISKGARYASEINGNNWYKILLKKSVEYGRSDPFLDPCGYRTLLVWKLAERYYGLKGLYRKLLDGMSLRNLRPKETDLLPLAQSGDLDYHFTYLSLARQHGFQYVTLPEEIDLGNPSLKNIYSEAVLELTDGKQTLKVRGKPIVYGITIVKGAPHYQTAVEFIKLLIGSKGQEILKDSFQEPLVPPVSPDRDFMPEALRIHVISQ